MSEYGVIEKEQESSHNLEHIQSGKKTLTIYVVPGTHHDVAWYLPEAVEGMRLARNLDASMEILDKHPNLFFSLDGQSRLLEMYRGFKHGIVSQLKKHLRNGQLTTGPSYVIAEQFLSGPETMIRNVQEGRKVAKSFGAKSQSTIDLSDTFGHIAQLPQIMKGLSIDSAMLWRGVGEEADELGSHFNWIAPNGDSVLTLRQIGSYGNISAMGYWTPNPGAEEMPTPSLDRALVRIDQIMAKDYPPFAKAGTPDLMLFSNRGDHKPLDPDLLTYLDEYKKLHPHIDFVVGTYDQYAQTIKDKEVIFGSYQGELSYGYDVSVLRGVNSTRIRSLKQPADRLYQNLIIAETIASLAHLQKNAAFPKDALREAWRLYLQGMHHDGITGCGRDEIYAEYQTRFANGLALTEQLIRQSMRNLADRETKWSVFERDIEDNRSVVNPLPWERVGIVETPIPNTKPFENVTALTAYVKQHPMDTEEKEVAVQKVGDKAVLSLTIGGFGSQQIRLEPGESLFDEFHPSIENDFYKITISEDKKFIVKDKKTGKEYVDVMRYEDESERGDEYNSDRIQDRAQGKRSPEQPQAFSITTGPVFSEITFTQDFALPKQLNEEKTKPVDELLNCPITTTLRLSQGIDMVEVYASIMNNAKDHRLRVLVTDPEIQPDTILAEGHFLAIERPLSVVQTQDDWAEQPEETHHTIGFVSTGNLVTFGGDGLHEYQATHNDSGGTDIALTLMRCIGELSRSDLMARPEQGAGPEFPTPGAQELGEHVVHFGFNFRGIQSIAEIQQMSTNFRIPLISGPAGIHINGLLEVSGENFGFSALKPAEDGKGAVLRIWNTDTVQDTTVLINRGVIKTNMEETTKSQLASTITLSSAEIASLRII